jgi:hypothetical protein
LIRQALDRLAALCPLVAAATPANWSAEIERLGRARRAGEPATPAFLYGLPRLPAGGLDALSQLIDELGALEAGGQEGRPTQLSSLRARGGHSPPLPLGPLLRRARELRLEMQMIEAMGSPAFVALARVRFASSPDDDRRALGWASLAVSEEEAPRVRSDDDRDPGSLLSAMRRAVGALRLPVRVAVAPGMGALAATGDGVVLIARDQALTARDVERVVLHEVEGHVRPWWARRQGVQGAEGPENEGPDAEEGRALRIEKDAGHLDRRRRKELGLRHVAAMLAHDEQRFDAIADRLEQLGATPVAAVRIAARALRGGGLGRERVYLPELWAHERRRVIPRAG